MPLSNVDPANYVTQLREKKARIEEQFAEFSPPELQVFESQALHFRARAEFKIWHEGDESFYAMFNREQPKQPVRIDYFPIGLELINRLMNELMVAIKSNDILRHKLFQIEFLCTLNNDALVTLIYHKPLDQNWIDLASSLQQKLDIKIIGRSKKQRLVLNQDFVLEVLTVGDRQIKYQQVENSFTQPNAQVNEKMLFWASHNSEKLGGDLVELYCGNGNFTVALAPHFDKVLATEISKTSVQSANYNFKMNGVENVSIARMSAEDFSSALAGDREFRRLKDINLTSYNFSTVLVDPPRAGLDSDTEALVTRFDNIIYISCNPNTLHHNLKKITTTHRIRHMAIFDQFPYTDHIECGVILERISR